LFLFLFFLFLCLLLCQRLLTQYLLKLQKNGFNVDIWLVEELEQFLLLFGDVLILGTKETCMMTYKSQSCGLQFIVYVYVIKKCNQNANIPMPQIQHCS